MATSRRRRWRCPSTDSEPEDPMKKVEEKLNECQIGDEQTRPIKESGTMDTSTGTAYSETTSADSRIEDSGTMVGDDCNTMDTSVESTSSEITSDHSLIESSRIPLEYDAPAGGSAMMSGEDSNSLQNGTEHPQYHKFHRRVVNDIVEFNEEESALLNKYLKFIIEPDFDENLAAELLSTANIAVEDLKLKPIELWRVKSELWEAIEKEQKKKKNDMTNQKFRAYKSTIQSINRKLLENEAIARKGDDGDFIVIIRKKEYNEKTKSYLRESGISEVFKEDITDDLKDLGEAFTDPIAPELIPLIKSDMSIKPFINTENSPVYNLSMELDKFIRDNYVFSSKYSVSSSMALINEIKNKQITNSSRLASLVIRNLYANVRVLDTNAIVENNLIKYGKVSRETITEKVKLLKRVATFNYFSFDNKFYKQKCGLIMGSSLSDTMADIFMNNVEQEVLESDRNSTNKIVYYGRSVDKMLLLVNGTEDDINDICSAFSKKIKIDDTEHECNNHIEFLDLGITRVGNQLTFKIVRKPTTTDLVIPNDSCHSQKDKEAAFRSLLDRAYNIPMSEGDRLHELNIIKQIAHSNGYEMDMVDRLWDEVRTKIVRAPYYGEMSEKLADIFKPYNVKFDFQAKNLVEYDLGRLDLEERKTKWEEPGVYKLKCKKKKKNGEECTSIYIGESKRGSLVRYSEHIRTVKQGEDHTHNPILEKVLHIEADTKRRQLLEKIQIAIHNVRDDCELLNKKIKSQEPFIDEFAELFKH